MTRQPTAATEGSRKLQEFASARIPAGYVVHLLEVVRELGGSPEALCEATALQSAELEAPDGLVRFSQLADTLLLAREQLHEPRIGLILGSRLSVTAHGVLGFAAISSNTPREALDLIVRYIHTRTPVSAVEIVPGDEYVLLRLHEQVPLGKARELYLETVSAAVVTSLRFLLSNRVEGFSLYFPYPEPAHREAYAETFRNDIHFNSERMEVRVPARFMDYRLPLADPVARERAARQCEEELRRLEEQLEITDRIRQILTPCRRQFPGQEEMARRLCLSERTLRRRLCAQGTSYRELLDQVREQLARQMLADTGQSVSRIAFDLGYDDPSNFGRAFRRWTGVSPGAYRDQQAGEG